MYFATVFGKDYFPRTFYETNQISQNPVTKSRWDSKNRSSNPQEVKKRGGRNKILRKQKNKMTD